MGGVPLDVEIERPSSGCLATTVAAPAIPRRVTELNDLIRPQQQ
jgi:hypothetical protein